MKTVTNLTILILILVGLISVNATKSQDLSAFEIMDNNSVGLTVAPSSKRGGCLVDIDRNGWADIYTLKYSSSGYSRLFINNEGHFTDITDQTPLQQIEDVTGVRTFNVVWADYDNDGDKDCSFGTDHAIYLLRNDNNFLTDVSEEMGFVAPWRPTNPFIREWFVSVCGWADYDNDGDLDCLVYQQNNPNLYLLRNDDTVFTDIASEVGLDSTKLSVDNFMNVIVWTDWDMDGDPDITGRHDFYANEDGIFREVTEEIGLGEVSWTNHKEFFDYDNDGDLDYFKITGRTEEGTNELWENQDGYYVDVSQETGVSLVPRDRYRGISTGDFDNDGDQDVFIQQNQAQNLEVFLVNDEVEPGARAFADVAEFVGLTKRGDRIGGGFFDYDNDGFLDIYVHSAEHNHILYHNLAISGGNWVGFILEGTISNRDAVGSFIWLYQGDKLQLRYTKAGSGYLRQDNPWVHFGLGYETSVDSVVIRWPLGYRQVLTDVAINQYHNIKEPDYLSAVETKRGETKPHVFRLEQNYPNPFNPVTRIDYVLPNGMDIYLGIYDVTGKEVITLERGYQTAGRHVVTWDGHDSEGNLAASGIYVYRMKGGNLVKSMKMVFAK